MQLINIDKNSDILNLKEPILGVQVLKLQK